MESSRVESLLWSSLMDVFFKTGVSLALYGIYICLFILSIYILARRRETRGTKLLMTWSCVIAVMATIRIAVTISEAVKTARIVEGVLSTQILKPLKLTVWPEFVLITVNNFVADFLYLYRCYVIWDCRWRIIILPGLFVISSFAVGIGGQHVAKAQIITKTQLAYSLAVAANLVITSFTAGRLLWIRRTASCVDAKNSFRARCNRAIGLVLQSGAMYCAAVISLLIAASLKASEAYVIEQGFGSQLVNIIPTFTLVYVGLDDTVDKSHLEDNPDAPRSRRTASRLVAVQRSQFTGVLDIKYGGLENKGGEHV
ncbi:hypothetical protein MSAN_02105400 [Mycena sanguinolenta]|uniref:Uncharacterized protein n=1 Tax=Mycena sanguinolenta TaxID=230812 RepID=A0A8H7CMI8_9AGAR|nr:hypothetical protein MSAN_02105400 [Mycena sanguinolenta]